jgi:hypothetical protein
MGARKTAAGLSAAGFVFVAGCGGGGALHTGMPSGSSGTPQNAKKISLAFTIPRSAPAVLEMPARQSPHAKNRRSAQSQTRVAPKVVRKPKYVSTATLNGSIGLYVYQGAQLASSQTFTVGFSNSYDFTCYFIPPIYSSLECYNTGNIYVPGGSDTFYAATYDSQHRVLSVTPGLPGTSVYGAAPAPINIPYSGAVFIQTYGIASGVTAINPTPCVNGNGTPFFFHDADGDIVTGPLAYPVTVNTGTFSMLYAGTSVGSNYTFYTAADPDYWSFASPGYLSGETGALSASSPTGTLAVNFPTVYSVNDTAFVASSSGLYAIGLSGGGSPSAYACGQVPLALYNSNVSPVTFSNPVAMTQDVYWSVVVLDDAGANPTVDVILANNLFVAPAIYVPVAQTTLPSTGGLDVAASQNLQAYILNSDGTIQRVDYTNAVEVPFGEGATNDGAIATSLTASAGSSIGTLTDISGVYDYVFASSSGSANLYEIDLANWTPEGFSSNLVGQPITNTGTNFYASVTTTAVATDQYAGSLYAFFRALDPGQSPGSRNVIVACTVIDGPPCITNIASNAYMGFFGDTGSMATVSADAELLLSSGSVVSALQETNTGSSSSFLNSLSSPGRVVSSPDSTFVGIQQGTAFYFTPFTSAAFVGSQTGTASTIWAFPFF